MFKKTVFLCISVLVCINLYGQKIYWVDSPSGKLQSVNTDGTVLSTLATGAGYCYSIAADLTNSKLYYTDKSNRTIKTCDLTGANPATLITQAAGSISIPRGIAVDVANSRIFWSDNGTKKIRRAALNGSGAADVVTGLLAPGYIAWDPANNKLYYADNGKGVKSIFRCNADGTGIQTVVTGLSQVRGIALNIPENTIYWVDNGSRKIQKGVFTTLPVTKSDVVTSLSGKLRGLAIDGAANTLYWADTGNDNIVKMNLSTSVQTIIASSVPFPQGLSLDWNSALPVELTSFSGSASGANVKLEWTTATEINNYGFEVEKLSVSELKSSLKENADDWKKIGFVKGNGTSSAVRHYSFTDNNARPGENQYRLKQIDNDGSCKYSEALSVSVSSPAEYKLHQNSPNPFNPVTSIKFELPYASHVELVVYDITGHEVIKLADESRPAGSHIMYWNGKDKNGSSVSSGVYLYRISTGQYTETLKMNFIK